MAAGIAAPRSSQPAAGWDGPTPGAAVTPPLNDLFQLALDFLRACRFGDRRGVNRFQLGPIGLDHRLLRFALLQLLPRRPRSVEALFVTHDGSPSTKPRGLLER